MSSPRVSIYPRCPRYVGYRHYGNPVPKSPQCLLPQAVEGITTTIYYRSAVEITMAVNPICPNNIVAAWQQGRIDNGGALELGIAYSHNHGKSWTQTVVPLQLCIGGVHQRLSDPWLDWSIDGRRVFLNALAFNVDLVEGEEFQSTVLVTYSDDNGATWSRPRILIGSQGYLNEPTGLPPLDDKNSLTADINHPRYVYSVWDRFPETISSHSDTFLARSIDQGRSWLPAQLIYNPTPDLARQGLSNGIENDSQTIDNKIIVLPERKFPRGDLLNFMTRLYATPNATDEEYVNDTFPYQFTDLDLAFIRSRDRGVTWEEEATIVAHIGANNLSIFTGGYTYDEEGRISGSRGTLIRDSSLITSETVDKKTGTVYASYISSEFRPDLLPQIALTWSRDGGRTWSAPIRANRTPQNVPNPQAFTPHVAVTENGYVGVLYADFRHDDLSDPDRHTLTDIWLDIYRDHCGGLRFVKEVRLSPNSFPIQRGPETGSGVMTTADYFSLAAVGDTFYTVFPLNSGCNHVEPTETLLDEPDGTRLILDLTVRTQPFFSRIQVEDC